MPNFAPVNSTSVNSNPASSTTYVDVLVDGIGVDDTHGMFRPSSTYTDVVSESFAVDDTHELFRIPTTYVDIIADDVSLTDDIIGYIPTTFSDTLESTFTLSDTVVGHIQSVYLDVISENLTIDDLAEQRGQITYTDVILEHKLLSENTTGIASALVLEALNIIQTSTSNTGTSITENINIIHTYIFGVGIIVNDEFTISSHISFEELFGIVESILISQQVQYPTSFSISAEEILTLADTLLQIISSLISENINILEQPSATLQGYSVLQEHIRTTHTDLTRTDQNILVANILTISDYLNVVAYADVAEEVATVSDDILNSHGSNVALVEAMEVMLAQEGKLIISLVVEDAVDLSEQSLHSLFSQEELVDGIQFLVSFDDGTHTYTGVTMSPETFGITEYDNYPFSGSTLFDGEYLLTNTSGLYKMEGVKDEDAFITSKIKTASIDFETSNVKQVPKVYLGIDNDTSLILRVNVDGTLGATYQLDLDKDNLSTQLIDIGKGLKGRYWQFELQSKGNTVFDLDEIELYPIVFGRKI